MDQAVRPDATRHARAYERYDWNSLIPDDDAQRAIQAEFMDGSSYFPSRPEMEASLTAFAERTDLRVRYDCRWESHPPPRRRPVRADDDRRASTRRTTLVMAVGVAEPWRPDTPGMELVAHYADTRPVETYADKRVFIIGKQNSGFELASGMLPWARRIVIASPSPAKLSVNTHSLVGIRARYLQPYEDNVLGGGVAVLDASIEAIERGPDGVGFVVRTRPSSGGPAMDFETDEVIAATGFVTPLRDLPDLGVATFGQSRLPAQTPVLGERHGARDLLRRHDRTGLEGAPEARHPGQLGSRPRGALQRPLPGRPHRRDPVRDRARAAGDRPERPPSTSSPPSSADGPELWNQRAYLARFIAFDPATGIRDDGIGPLAPFVDEAAGGDALAITLETDGSGAVYPVLYARVDGRLDRAPARPPPAARLRRPRTHAARSSRSWPGSAPASAEPERHLETALVAGIAAGLGVAVPFGAIAVLIVETSIRRGRVFGWAAGAGAATADLTYATLAALFGTALADLIAPVQVPLRWVSVVGPRRDRRPRDRECRATCPRHARASPASSASTRRAGAGPTSRSSA